MNLRAVYPPANMRVACPNCRAQGRARIQRPPREDFTALCPKCKQRFLIKINRRKYYRKNTTLPVAYSRFDIERPDDLRASEGTIINISRQGMGVQSYRHNFSPEYCKAGSLFTFLFSLPFINDLKKVKGEIIRIAKVDEEHTFTMGVGFSNLHQYTSNAIGFFLSFEPE